MSDSSETNTGVIRRTSDAEETAPVTRPSASQQKEEIPIPPNEIPLSPDAIPLPLNEISLPPNEIPLPSNQIPSPSHEIPLPSNESILPSDEITSLPVNHHHTYNTVQPVSVIAYPDDNDSLSSLSSDFVMEIDESATFLRDFDGDGNESDGAEENSAECDASERNASEYDDGHDADIESVSKEEVAGKKIYDKGATNRDATHEDITDDDISDNITDEDTTSKNTTDKDVPDDDVIGEGTAADNSNYAALYSASSTEIQFNEKIDKATKGDKTANSNKDAIGDKNASSTKDDNSYENPNNTYNSNKTAGDNASSHTTKSEESIENIAREIFIDSENSKREILHGAGECGHEDNVNDGATNEKNTGGGTGGGSVEDTPSGEETGKNDSPARDDPKASPSGEGASNGGEANANRLRHPSAHVNYDNGNPLVIVMESDEDENDPDALRNAAIILPPIMDDVDDNERVLVNGINHPDEPDQAAPRNGEENQDPRPIEPPPAQPILEDDEFEIVPPLHLLEHQGEDWMAVFARPRQQPYPPVRRNQVPVDLREGARIAANRRSLRPRYREQVHHPGCSREYERPTWYGDNEDEDDNMT